MEYIVTLVVGFVVGAVASYLFFRVNPNKRKALDEKVDRV